MTLSNPLNLAVIGNPGPRRRRSKRAAKVSQLKSRWKKRTRPGGRWAGYKAVIRSKAGRKVKVRGKGRRWAFTGRKGTVSLHRRNKLVATNPVNAIKRTVVTPLTSLPKSLPALFKGKVAKNVLFAGGGAVTGLVGGNLLQSTIMGALNRFMPAAIQGALSNGIVQRVIGASFALVAGGVVGRFALKSTSDRASFITGTAAAALVEAVFPGRVAGLMSQLPIVGPYLAPIASPVNGLAGIYGSDELAAYVESPAYQGVGAYVESPAYQGVGAYVESPAYQGVGGPMDNAVAGLGYDPNQLAGGHLNGLGAMGSNMASHLD